MDQYSSGTEAGIEGAERKVKGAAKKIAGALTGRDDLTEEGGADSARGDELVKYSRQQSEASAARANARRDTVLRGGERR
ncbi:MAG: hypothetical protein K0R68_2684 [Mycobacterium sp.]|nr:hypothetical protein [Mycobacterium sp.]